MRLFRPILIALLAFYAFCLAACTSTPKKPNVLILYLDDLGYGDVSAYGKGMLQTPNMDALLNGGIRFTQGYATSATCSPSRYALLSGEYPWKNQRAKILPGDAPILFDTAQVTLPKAFLKAGYETAVIGKWHMGLGNGNINWNQKIAPNPNHIGFSYSYIMAATNDRTPSVYVENGNVVGLEEKDPLFVSYKENFEGEPTAITHPELMTKQTWHHGHNQSVHNGIPRIGYMKGGKNALWVDEDMADHFLEKVKTFLRANSQKPFFLFYALHQPHVPRVPHPRFVGKSGMGPRGDAILEADWCIGEVMKELEKQGVLENTLVLLSSDNGPVLNDGYFDDAVEKIGEHTPSGGLRGGKYSLYEAGTRVPFGAYWKGTIQPKVSEAIVSQLDFAASLSSLIGSKESFPDSKNQMEVLLGKSENGREELVLEATGRVALRQGKYLFIPAYAGNTFIEQVQIENGSNAEVQLFDLEKDLSQQNNLAKENTAIASNLGRRLNELTFQYTQAPTKLELK